MQIALIIGGSGFIGKYLIKLLQKNGYRVRILSRRKLPDIESYVCDLLTLSIPKEAFKGVTLVVHLAGYTSDIESSNEVYEKYERLNYHATKALAEIADNESVEDFIFFSSVKAGGIPPVNFCASEDDYFPTLGLYGESKRRAEKYLLNMSVRSRMKINIIRPSIVYGPEMKGNLSSMLKLIKKGFFPPLPQTHNVKSMIHVDDLVELVLFLIKKKYNRQIFIATDGIQYSSNDLYKQMCYALGKKIRKYHVPLIFFKLIGLLGKNLRFKIKKIFSSECYSSKKLVREGFKTTRNLSHINISDYR